MRTTPRDIVELVSASACVLAIFALTPALVRAQLPASAQVYEFGDNALRRFDYFIRPRQYPFATMPAHVSRAQQWMRRTRLAATAGLAAAPLDPATPWSPLGPSSINGPPGDAGRVTSLALDPRNSQVIYLGAAQGGIWKTTNGGASWTPMGDNECSLAIGSVTLDPVNPDIVYAGTGEGNFSGDSYYGCGILKSINAGATWTVLGSALWDFSNGGARIGRIQVVPGTAPASTTLLAATSSGLFRTINAGVNWTNTLAGTVTDVVLDPSNPANVYAAIGLPQNSATNGVYKSIDGGVTFTKLTNGLPAVAAGLGRVSLAISASDPLTLIAAIHNFATHSLLGLYKTIDGGASWTKLNATGASCASQCWYDMVVAIDPANPNTVYFGGLSFYRSLDGGTTFTDVGFIHVDHHAIVVDPTAPGTVLAGSDGGVYRTVNSGAAWTSLNTNLAITQFYPGVSTDLPGQRVMGGTQDNGTLKFTGPLVWRSEFGGDGGYTAVNPATGVTFVETQWGGSYSGPRRSDLNYNQVVSGISLSDNGLFIPPLEMDLARPTTLYFGTSRLYRTQTNGTNWSIINTNPAKSTCCVAAIGPSQIDSNTVYVGTSDGNLQVTTNGGTAWTTRISGLPNRAITDVIVHRSNPLIAYVTFSGFGTGHVFRTNNGGVSWTNISANLPDMPVNAIVLLPGGELDVGTDLGVYRSSDDGATWSLFTGGMPNVAVFDLTFVKATNTLVAATHGRGMFVAGVNVQAPATLLAMNTQPGGAMPDVTFTRQPKVSVHTAGGDPVLSAAPVSASILSGTGTLQGTTTVNALNGVATFTNLKINGFGVFTLAFSSPGLTTTTATFNVGVLRGDVTDDGVVAAADAQAVLQGVLGIALPAGYKPYPNGDANCSGGLLQVIDAQLILAKLIGITPAQSCVGVIR